MTDFDFSELTRLTADLGEVPKKTGPLIRKALEVTSRNVKDAARASVKSGDRTWRALPGAISYEMKTFQGFGASVIEAEIGYDKSKAGGKLGNVREFGTPRVAPHLDLQRALQENQEDFQKGLDIALGQALREAGL